MTDKLFDVSGTVAVVTGGLGQLGAQYAKAFLERGGRVVIFDVHDDREKARGRLGAWVDDERLLLCAVDVTDRASIEGALAAAEARFGTPDVLINNAGIDTPPDVPAALEVGPFETYPADSWDRVMAVNVKGVFLCCQVVGGAMAKAGRGSIINVSSIYGVVSPDQNIYEYRRQRGEVFFKPVAYSASKSALINLTHYLATYWARQGVRVNTLVIAGVFANQDPGFLAAYEGRIPIGRMANEDEYCGAVLFLASPASTYMTGASLVVDGGWTAI
ncbi:MAG: SDR family oxidoreductase [Rhodospirillales bacterium]|nr:SDR family oxidoreductase [Rhodospirillales bacterium]